MTGTASAKSYWLTGGFTDLTFCPTCVLALKCHVGSSGLLNAFKYHPESLHPTSWFTVLCQMLPLTIFVTTDAIRFGALGVGVHMSNLVVCHGFSFDLGALSPCHHPESVSLSMAAVSARHQHFSLTTLQISAICDCHYKTILSSLSHKRRMG